MFGWQDITLGEISCLGTVDHNVHDCFPASNSNATDNVKMVNVFAGTQSGFVSVLHVYNSQDLSPSNMAIDVIAKFQLPESLRSDGEAGGVSLLRPLSLYMIAVVYSHAPTQVFVWENSLSLQDWKIRCVVDMPRHSEVRCVEWFQSSPSLVFLAVSSDDDVVVTSPLFTSGDFKKLPMMQLLWWNRIQACTCLKWTTSGHLRLCVQGCSRGYSLRLL